MENLALNVILCVAFAVSGLIPHARERRVMLMMNAASCLLFLIYFAGMEAYAGFAALLIAMVGSLVQALIPEKHIERTGYLRLGIAGAMALLSVLFCYRQASDLMPLVAAVVVRFGEANKSGQVIRVTQGLSLVLWTAYNLNESLYLAAFGDAVLLVSYCVGIVTAEMRVHNWNLRSPVPARAAPKAV